MLWTHSFSANYISCMRSRNRLGNSRNYWIHKARNRLSGCGWNSDRVVYIGTNSRTVCVCTWIVQTIISFFLSFILVLPSPCVSIKKPCAFGTKAWVTLIRSDKTRMRKEALLPLDCACADLCVFNEKNSNDMRALRCQCASLFFSYKTWREQLQQVVGVLFLFLNVRYIDFCNKRWYFGSNWSRCTETERGLERRTPGPLVCLMNECHARKHGTQTNKQTNKRTN